MPVLKMFKKGIPNWKRTLDSTRNYTTIYPTAQKETNVGAVLLDLVKKV